MNMFANRGLIDAAGAEWSLLPWENGIGADNNWAATPLSEIGKWGGNDWAKLTGFKGTTYNTDRDSPGTSREFLDYLQQQGYRPSFRNVNDKMVEYQLFDKAGKAVGDVHQVRADDKGDLMGILGIASLPFIVGGLNGAGFLGGAEAAGASSAAETGALGFGLEGGAGYITPTIGGSGAGGLSAAATAAAENGALGFGMGGGAGYITPTISGTGGLVSTALNTVRNLSPRTIATIAGAVAGGSGGEDGGGGKGPEWTADKPTVDRGGWQSKVTPTYGELADGGLLNVRPGYRNSGLWRFVNGG